MRWHWSLRPSAPTRAAGNTGRTSPVRGRKSGTRARRIDVIRRFYNHPGFIEAVAARTADALAELPAERRNGALLLFTAHSIPVAMADAGPYEAQLGEACRLVAESLGRARWQLAYQSRSGPPSQPWLVPDVESALRAIAATGDAQRHYHRANRLPARPHGSGVRPGCRSPRALRRAWIDDGPSLHRRPSPALRANDSRVDS